MRKLIPLMLLAALLLAACSAPTPAYQDGDTISWEEAVEILNQGDVEQIFQTHSLDVTLTLEDGSQLHTVEPHIDAIFNEIEACGAPCSDILMATE